MGSVVVLLLGRRCWGRDHGGGYKGAGGGRPYTAGQGLHDLHLVRAHVHARICVLVCVSVHVCVQESLESEAVLDVMEGEQTWPTEEELCEAEGGGGKSEGG